MGLTFFPSGVGSVKPYIPCFKGRLPVAIEVHSIGLSDGVIVEMLPDAPSAINFAKFGILPASIRGPAMVQSAASQPRTSTFESLAKSLFSAFSPSIRQGFDKSPVYLSLKECPISEYMRRFRPEGLSARRAYSDLLDTLSNRNLNFVAGLIAFKTSSDVYISRSKGFFFNESLEEVSRK